MHPEPGPCRGCGTALHEGGLAGFCPRCLGTAAFAVETEPGTEPGSVSRRLGGYELLEEIGRGGMGVVYRARQPGLSREVAVKVLRDGPFARPEERDRFRREAGAAASLRHPHIVAVHEVGEADGHLYFSMELVRGRSLAELTREGPLEPRRAAGYTVWIAEAAAAAHARGVLHRDLKPGNIILDEEDRPHITDFGLARRLDADGTQTMSVVGSPGYMPPEQADPQRGPVTVAADVYALGALLYHLLTGRPPFAAATPTATLAQVLQDEPAGLRRLNSAVPRDLETICLKCLRKEPAQRYASATALATDLRAFLERRPIAARPVGGFERAFLWLRRRPALAGLGAALLLASALGLGGVLWQWRLTQLHLYAADLRIAAEAVELGNLGRARELLDLHAPMAGDGDFAWRLLRAYAAGDPRTVLGHHPWIVGAVAWSPDGGHLASASVGSGTVAAELRLWQPDQAAAEPLLLSTNGARELAWFPDNRRLLAVHFDGQARIWDTVDQRVVTNLSARSASLSTDGRWLATCEGDPFAWDSEGATGAAQLRNLVSGETRTLPAARLVAMSPGGRLVAVTDFRGTIALHDPREGELRRTLNAEGGLWALEFSEDERFLVATGFDNDVRLWDLTNPDPRPQRLRGHTLHTWRAAFSPDGALLATTASDQTLRWWDLRTGREVGTWRGHGSEVWCVAFHPDGSRVVSGGKDRAVIVWPRTTARTPQRLESHRYSRPVFSPDGRWLASTSATNGTRVLRHDLRAPDQAQLIGAGRPLAVRAGSGEVLTQTAAFQLQWLAGASVVAPPPITLAHDVDEPPPARWTAAPDGALVAGVNAAGRASLWSTGTGTRQRALPLPALTVWELQLSPDGQWLAVTAGEDGFWLCSWRTGAARRITAHFDQGKWAAFSPDSRTLATASVDATIKLWDVVSGRERATLRGHPTEVTAVAFAPDGVTLASIEHEQGLRLWHLPTLREVASLSLPAAQGWLGFTPDGRTLGILQHDGAIRLLPAP